MFIAALLTIAKLWKEPKYPSTDEWIKKMWCVCVYVYIHMCMCVYTYIHTHTYTHIMEYYLAMRKNEILPFATTWMELEGIMLSEISQRKTDIMFSLICGI